MYEKLYRMDGRKPAEELHRLLTEIRVHHARFQVTLGTPPFERDAANKITAIRVRFKPAGQADGSRVSADKPAEPSPAR